MKILTTKIPGCLQLIPDIRRDERGSFVKTFHQEIFADHGLETRFAEEYYSASKKGVLRGMHFQTPPVAHTKVVYCVSGEVVDAVVDLRIGSPTYGQHETFTLNEKKGSILYIPSGLAHGFYVKSDMAIMLYKVTTVYAPEYDAGILWNSAGIQWPSTSPLLSGRDCGFPRLQAFDSPFRFHD
ncbi:dTDP-4-dehydrorhamnose 3,5-epimerase [Acidithiobacillus ferriphilus]|uniref:dTDP-4-dehydrorhamnose 3,5-epimerase n=1 Tax=Acidithiobacillus ferriphilus TaxID=1689834 RepID=UPI001C06D3F1|nr:dTDP-4-dehydrorhamnose 3,5-epimerase [Acidithiobacillus ferriphilus]MBU2853303.1 dTDP-4-dehydrorhamnose 3,5-epimerase [Acidithiobacillus ferriphilus]